MQVEIDRGARTAPIEHVEQHVLGMAELGLRGLSEQWLLRRLGDLHWRLIAKAFGQSDAVFVTQDGRPAYAAFCALSIDTPGLALPQLGDRLRIDAQLYRVSRSRHASIHRLALASGGIGTVTMIATFVARGSAGSNQSIARVVLRDLADLLLLPVINDLPRRTADLASGRVTRHLGLAAFPGVCAPIVERSRPCPATDFNAAGLLYFPSFVALTDHAEWAAFPGLARNPVTLRRDVLYSGNIDGGDAVEARLLDSAAAPGSLRHSIQLTRDDGKPLCTTFTHRAL